MIDHIPMENGLLSLVCERILKFKYEIDVDLHRITKSIPTATARPFSKPMVGGIQSPPATGKSAGRNSSGRITVFHRGGGSKRLQRKIDLKRSTSSMGIVERIEYDPNRSSQIALVRWIEGVLLRRQSPAIDTENRFKSIL
ncbi:hypothetical protein KSP40_PGU010980 [Platanthera guangdongensis]|uniref:Large ribosomal subunit protein uL2 RNA-binding domain-containing protein n=1 Tax=Platanthera guangdongensis TaxID=2320717 RepID=A0ABR2M2K3_9ASPA